MDALIEFVKKHALAWNFTSLILASLFLWASIEAGVIISIVIFGAMVAAMVIVIIVLLVKKIRQR